MEEDLSALLEKEFKGKDFVTLEEYVDALKKTKFYNSKTNYSKMLTNLVRDKIVSVKYSTSDLLNIAKDPSIIEKYKKRTRKATSIEDEERYISEFKGCIIEKFGKLQENNFESLLNKSFENIKTLTGKDVEASPYLSESLFITFDDFVNIIKNLTDRSNPENDLKRIVSEGEIRAYIYRSKDNTMAFKKEDVINLLKQYRKNLDLSVLKK